MAKKNKKATTEDVDPKVAKAAAKAEKKAAKKAAKQAKRRQVKVAAIEKRLAALAKKADKIGVTLSFSMEDSPVPTKKDKKVKKDKVKKAKSFKKVADADGDEDSNARE